MSDVLVVPIDPALLAALDVVVAGRIPGGIFVELRGTCALLSGLVRAGRPRPRKEDARRR